MTAAAGFKRLGIAIAAVAVICIVALTAMSWFISDDSVRKATQAEIRNVTGLDLVLRGGVTVSLFPSGSVSFDNVTLGDDAKDGSKPVLEADQLTARLRFFPLLTGHIEIADVSLVRPHVNVTFDRDGHSNWAALVDTLARALGPKANRPADAASFTEIRIADGTVTVDDASHGINETLQHVELALAWPSISKSFAATGNFVWHGQAVDSTISLADFAMALAGERSGLKVRLTGAPIKLAFEGNWSTKPTLQVEGTLAADAASFRDTLRWAGIQPLSGGGFGRFALKAKTSISSSSLALTAANVELDGNVAEGVLTFQNDGRQTVQGTLAADELNLTPYISTIRVLASNDRDWDRVPMAMEGFNGFDLDLRLSAAHMTVARAKFGRTAVAANLRGGKLKITVGESQAFGGVLKGTVALGASGGGVDFKSQLQFTDVDLQECLNELLQFSRIDGRGDIAVSFDASGNSVLGLTRTLNGTASLTGRNGSLVGWNVEQLLRRLERRPLSGTGDFRNGKTPFEKLAIGLKITDGVATVDNLDMQGSKVRLGLSGSASIPARDFDLRGVASLASTSTTDTTPPFELPFVVEGPWDDPILLPDTQSLLARSPLASPLLNAVKSRSTRDTVRSAIERLTGGAISPPAGAPNPDR